MTIQVKRRTNFQRNYKKICHHYVDLEVKRYHFVSNNLFIILMP